MIVNHESYPHLLKAMQLIYEDADMGPETPTEFKLDDMHEANATEIEHCLGTLSPEDLVTFCTGEQEDQEEITKRSPGLRQADAFLEAFFAGDLRTDE